MALTPSRWLTHGAVSPTAHTDAGRSLDVVVPLPSCPPPFSPQAATVPFSSNAKLWPLAALVPPPPAIAVTPVSPLTATGNVLQAVCSSLMLEPRQSSGPTVEPSPSCPSLFAPHATATLGAA